MNKEHDSHHNCGVCASVGFRRENEERGEDENGSFYDFEGNGERQN